MKVLTLIISGLFFLNLSANEISFASRSFKANDKKFVFIDIKKANYKIIYDSKSKTTRVYSELYFRSFEDGYPLFDLVPKLERATLDNNTISVEEVSHPKNITKSKFMNELVKAGDHVLKTIHYIKTTSYKSNKIRSAFWFSDLNDRRFLEAYLPTNFDFDRVSMNFDIKVINTQREHEIKVNCPQRWLSKNHWQIKCPKHFNSASIFYHLFEKGRFKSYKKKFKSIDGRIVTANIYGPLSMMVHNKVKPIFDELEGDFGPMPHEHLIIYAAIRSGGMEYAGATITSPMALGHEMHHFYFARSMFPAGGNAGWIDEALASWRDKDYMQVQNLTEKDRTIMGAHSQYMRVTDRNAYSKGARFMAHLDYKFKSKGGMKSFAKDLHEKYMRNQMTTKILQSELEKYFNTSLDSLFDEFIYGKKGISTKQSFSENPIHRKLTKKQMQEIL